MPTVIIHTDVDLDGFYNYTMEYLDAKYHQYPAVFEDLFIPDEVAAQLSCYNEMASHISNDRSHAGVPIGKQVY